MACRLWTWTMGEEVDGGYYLYISRSSWWERLMIND